MSARELAHGEARIGEPRDRSFLSDVERSYFARFSADKRCDEFLAGRLAVRRAIARLLHADTWPIGLSIERQDDGAPKIVGLHVELAISISHAKTRAIAIAALGPSPVGVDLTDDADAARIRRVARRAFPRAHERALALVDDRTACRAWAMKEAVAKALRMGLLEQGGFERIEVLDVERPRVSVQGDAREVEVTVEVEEVEGGVRAVAMKGAGHDLADTTTE